LGSRILSGSTQVVERDIITAKMDSLISNSIKPNRKDTSFTNPISNSANLFPSLSSVITICSQDASNFNINGLYAFDVREKLSNVANFGSGGAVCDYTFDFKTVGNNFTESILNTCGCDIWWSGYEADTSYTIIELNEIQNWIDNGGLVIAGCDDEFHDPICGLLSLSVSSINVVGSGTSTLTPGMESCMPNVMGSIFNGGGVVSTFSNTANLTVITTQDQLGNEPSSVFGNGIWALADINMLVRDFCCISTGANLTTSNDFFLANGICSLVDEGLCFQGDTDADGDGVGDSIDIDNDNDGLRDTKECLSIAAGRVNFDNLTGIQIFPDEYSIFCEVTGAPISPPILQSSFTVPEDPTTITLDFSVPIVDVYIHLASIHSTTNLGNFNIVLLDGTVLNNVDFELSFASGDDDFNFLPLEAGSNLNWGFRLSKSVGGSFLPGTHYVESLGNQSWGILKFKKYSSKLISAISFETKGSTNMHLGISATPCIDCDDDGDMVFNHLDLDSDNDGIYDAIEAGGMVADPDFNGIIGLGSSSIVDSDSDGWSDIVDSDVGGTPLTDPDTDLDGKVNRIDIDSDGDECYDVWEAGFDDDDFDGGLGSSPVNVDLNGLVTSGSNGYTDPNGIYLNIVANGCIEVCGNGLDDNGNGQIDEGYPGDVQDNLFLWLKADEGFTGFLWEDQSIRNNNAVLFGDPSISAGVMNFNLGISFDGDDHVEVDLPELKFQSGTNSVAIFVVYKPNTASSTLGIYGNHGQSSLNQDMGLSTGAAYSGTGNSTVTQLSGNKIHMATYVIDEEDNISGSTNSTKVYYNGVDVKSLTYNEVSASSVDSNFHIGKLGAKASDPYFDGDIYEIIIYYEGDGNYAITSSEREKIESYLATKYGITLPFDYTNSQ